MSKRHIHAFRDKLVKKGRIYSSHRLWQDKTYELDPGHCASSFDRGYHRRALDLLGTEKYGVVFEIAAGVGLFAEMFLDEHPETSKYVVTDISGTACQLARKRLKKHIKRAKIKMFDVTSGLDTIAWHNKDLIVCTSMEHFPVKTHYEILEKISAGTHVLFRQTNQASKPIPVIDSACGINMNDHPHVYKTVEYTRNIYKDYVDIISCYQFGIVIYMYGIIKTKEVTSD